MDEPPLASRGRARRAVALMGIAALALAVAAAAYLGVGARPRPARPPGPPPELASLDWLPDGGGWVVLRDRASGRSVLFHTADAGRHWERQFATVTALVTVRFIDSQRGILTERDTGNSNATVLRTDDGGDHWAPIPLPMETDRQPTLADFVDPDHGWLLVSADREPIARDVDILQTEDGGLDWSRLVRVDRDHPAGGGLDEAPTKTSLWFQTDRDGWLGAVAPDGSVVLYVTHDGGVAWRRSILPAPPGGWNAGDALLLSRPRISPDGRGAFVVTDLNRLDATLGRPPPAVPIPPPVLVYVSGDGGDTWADPRPAPAGVDPRTAGSGFVNGETGWLGAGSTLWLTTDSGRTWSRQPDLPGGHPMAYLAPADGSVAAVQVVTGTSTVFGDFPWRLMLTEDGGRTWRPVAAPALS
ncbi:MAG TPA: hypothetical protein VKF59_12185 [Candidatus Dormibacteraeota bacterium]|nr:hypothetical protein [Candidatus Dormibacteraeota bacterium]